MKFYTKEPRGKSYRYVPVEGNPHMPSDGLWLVSLNGASKKRILPLGEVEKTDTTKFYAQLTQEDYHDLAKFIALNDLIDVQSTVSLADNTITWSYSSNSEKTEAILYFLSMNPQDRKDALLKLEGGLTTEYHNDSLTIRDKAGRKRFSISPHNKSCHVTNYINDIDIQELVKERKKLEAQIKLINQILQPQ